MDTFCNVEEGHGLECYRLLARDCDPRVKSTHRGKLIKILEPEAETLNGTYHQRLAKWERTWKDHEKLTGKTIDEDMKVAVLQHKIAPPEMMQHLALHAGRLEKYKDMLDEIEEFIAAKVDADGNAMDVSALTWDPVKKKFIDPKKR